MIQPIKTCTLTILTLLFFFQSAYASVVKDEQSIVHEMKLESMGKRILIVVPHPDDETLATGGLIQRALQSGKKVRLLMLTNGDGFRLAAANLSGTPSPRPEHYKLLGEQRQTELLRATAKLGLSKNQVRFLGFPDAGLHLLWREYWNEDTKLCSRTGHTECPYDISVAAKAPYTGQQLVKLMVAEISRFRPTDVFYPDTEDSHNDHWAAGAFTRYVLRKHKHKVQEWSYLVHYPDWPHSQTCGSASVLPVPGKDRMWSTNWHSLRLSETEVSVKALALDEHRSQMQIMPDFLRSFIRTNELYKKIEC
ncbi:PIG-L deacetylase family protein [Effusibacillus lacus]|uniref:LmbE family protein n=1 Tax=Effusibacillus lacus TaxID=1348429 RepID=A0A292YNZ1_9BACL|nr:PIG-L family deacetylase [Effusibacillus lacus]TCS70632.1 LmbE family N-acetylglucosaminyl deacetylase [Effusibacillus lacus]GAX90629.1 LmbE family protein [Effusibacillus lacus]